MLDHKTSSLHPLVISLQLLRYNSAWLRVIGDTWDSLGLWLEAGRLVSSEEAPAPLRSIISFTFSMAPSNTILGGTKYS